MRVDNLHFFMGWLLHHLINNKKPPSSFSLSMLSSVLKVQGRKNHNSNLGRTKNSSKKNKFSNKKSEKILEIKKTEKRRNSGFIHKKSANKKTKINQSKTLKTNNKKLFSDLFFIKVIKLFFFYEFSKIPCGIKIYGFNIWEKIVDNSQSLFQSIGKIKFISNRPKKRGRKRMWNRTKERLLYFWQVRWRKLGRRLYKRWHSSVRLVKTFLRLQKGKGRPKKPHEVVVYSYSFRNYFFRKLKIFYLHFPWKITFSFLITFLIIFGSWQSYIFLFADLPSPLELVTKEQNVTTKILDRNGILLYRIYGDENRTIVPLSRVSQDLIDATIAIEDKDFYDHHGFSISGIVRASWQNIENNGVVQGGSTITQQLVKNRLLSSERTLKRKVRELILSILVEGTFTKDEILEMYLNQVAYGGSTYGIEEASWRYFNKSASQLTLAESALLAGLPQAPSIYTPFGANPEFAYARQEEVLRRMLEDEYISNEEYIQAKDEKLILHQDVIDIRAPHFVMYVKKILAERFGEDVLHQGGLEVRTTLDFNLQQQVQEKVVEEMVRLEKLRVNNGAVVVTNPKTGEILSMVGSKNYFDFAHDGQVNVVLRPRQPGSSIKPLTYAISMENGKNPASILQDTPITYSILGSPPYTPKNYDGKFHGNVTLRESLASSYNIPAVKELAGIGVSNYIEKAERLGITTWKDTSRFGLSLTLGGGEVRMIDMAQLYSAFANYGYPVEPNPFLEIKNYKGEVFYRNNCALSAINCYTTQELDPKVAYLISDILSDNLARANAFGLNSVLHIPGQQVAVKTGTTNSLRDNWTIGYTTDRLVAVWVGNNDNTPMSYVASGITGASPIWNNVMRLLLDETNPHVFSLPSGLTKVQICATTGTLPCSGCPVVREEIFIIGTEPTIACSSEYFNNRIENSSSNISLPAPQIFAR